MTQRFYPRALGDLPREVLPMRAYYPSDSSPQVCPAAAPSRVHAQACSSYPICTPDTCAIAPYDPEAFADLLCEQPALAAQQLDALSDSARTRQALAHVTWLEDNGVQLDLDTVLTAWTTLIGDQRRYALAPDTTEPWAVALLPHAL